MTKEKHICLYCNTKVKVITREGTCSKCHKINDEKIVDNEQYDTCAVCGDEIYEEDIYYVEGEGNCCSNCSTYCETCQRHHLNEDVNYCNMCSNNTCNDLQKCTICKQQVCIGCLEEGVCYDCIDKKKKKEANNEIKK
jgi:hypothetical protein